MNPLSKISKNNNKNLKHQYLWPDRPVCVCVCVCEVNLTPHTVYLIAAVAEMRDEGRVDDSAERVWPRCEWSKHGSESRSAALSGHCPATFRSLLGNEIIRLTLKNRWNPRSTLQTWNTTRNVIKARLPAHLISGTAGFKQLHILSCKCYKDLNRATVWSVVCQMTFYFTLSLC